jgi:hypothetical protein
VERGDKSGGGMEELRLVCSSSGLLAPLVCRTWVCASLLGFSVRGVLVELEATGGGRRGGTAGGAVVD